MTEMAARPTWDQFKAFPRKRDEIAAVAVLESEGGEEVLRDAARWLHFGPRVNRSPDEGALDPIPMMSWREWVADVDERGRGWSSAPDWIFQAAAAVAADRPLPIWDCAGQGAGEVWLIFALWSQGGPIVPWPGGCLDD